MTLDVNKFLPKDVSNYIFSYLSSSDLGHVALTSKEMEALSLSQRLKKAREILEEASKFQGIIQLPSFNPKSEDINEYNTAICSILQKIKSIPIFQKIFVTNHGNFSQVAQEIKDRDLVIVLKRIGPGQIQQQMKVLPNSRAAALARNWLKTLDPQDDFFQKADLAILNSPLTSIPPEICTYFPNLKMLNLSNNDIQAIPPEIGRLQNLRILHLNDNQIQAIPLEIGQLQNLGSLRLDKNQIQVIPPQFGQLRNLQYLYLDYNKIQVIPPQFGQLQNLTWLRLCNNQIQIIPPEIGLLKNLQQLHLGNNQIQVIPPEIGQLQNLQGLALNHNQIQVIPPEIGGLKNLQVVLCLDDNQIRSIPPEIERLQHLQMLCLNNNQIQVVPPEIGQLRSLQKLYLDNNPIQFMPLNLQVFIIHNDPCAIHKQNAFCFLQA